MAEGGELLEELVATRERASSLRAAWHAESQRLDGALPIWERGREIEAWHAWTDAETRVTEAYTEINRTLQRALEIVPSGWKTAREARDILARLNLIFFRDANERGAVALGREFFADRVLENGGESYRDRVQGGARVRFTTRPAGATVYCLRYVSNDYGTRVTPVPFRSTAVSRRVIVDRVWPRYASERDPPPFRPGDRIVALGSTPVRTLEELASALVTVGRGTPVFVRVVDSSGTSTRSWVPFASDREVAPLTAGHLIDPLLQLGITFGENLLDLDADSEIGLTAEDRPAEIALSRGSYLLVFEKPGYLAARYPIATANAPEHLVSIDLVASANAPDGFVHVPSGFVATGGDPDSFQAERWGSHPVDGFLIGKHEITVREWLEFVNWPSILRRTDLDGGYRPQDSAIIEELERGGLSERISLFLAKLVDDGDGAGWWSRKSEDAPWEFDTRNGDLDWPAFGVSNFAAREYCLWRTRRSKESEFPARFRLPTDLEWERAARGVDRRIYAWGDYMVWSYCRSFQANLNDFTYPVGSAPIDESPFGLRDVTGSCAEHTIGRPVPRRAYRSVRGGDWVATHDAVYFRLASRNTMYPENPAIGSGFRVVMEIPSVSSR